VVVVGGGFGGLYVAKALSNHPVAVTLIDRKNHHTFQPLLHQVATSVLSPGEIAEPLRRILHDVSNVEVLLDKVTGFDLFKKIVHTSRGMVIAYDYLVVSAGARHSYFDHPEWEKHSPGLKAINIRRRLLAAFEGAELEASLFGEYPIVFCGYWRRPYRSGIGRAPSLILPPTP
jgi:NADH:ubiquinone reductase (H+-translocating)